MRSIIIISCRKVHTSVLWHWLTKAVSSPHPSLFPPHVQYICCKCITEDRGNPSSIASYKLFLSDIKVKILLNVKVVHIPGKLYWYWIFSSQVLNFHTSRNCHFRLLLGGFYSSRKTQIFFSGKNPWQSTISKTVCVCVCVCVYVCVCVWKWGQVPRTPKTLSILFETLTNDDMQDNASDMLRFLLKY